MCDTLSSRPLITNYIKKAQSIPVLMECMFWQSSEQLASSRYSVRWGAARKKTARENKRKKRKEWKLSLAALFSYKFSRAVFRAAPQLSQCLEEATW